MTSSRKRRDQTDVRHFNDVNSFDVDVYEKIKGLSGIIQFLRGMNDTFPYDAIEFRIYQDKSLNSKRGRRTCNDRH